MNDIIYPEYELSDEFLESLALSVESGKFEGLRGGAEGDDVLKEAISQVRRHRSRIGLSTNPAVWSLDNYYPTPGGLETAESVKICADSFILVRFGVHIEPESNERVTNLILNVEFAKESGCYTFDQLPSTTLESKIKAAASGRLGIGGDLKFNVTSLYDDGVSVGGEIDVGGKVSLLMEIDYDWKIARVISTGVDTQHARWRVQYKEFVGFLPFYAVIRCSENKTEMKCSADIQYSIKMPHRWEWLRLLKNEVGYRVAPLSISIGISQIPQAPRLIKHEEL